MHFEPWVAVAGLVVGFVVGLTGMGGGALMTPILVLLFKVQPLAAVSSDLVASMLMKPVGGAVHLRRGTVHRGLVGWLALGSVPAALAGVFAIKLMGHNPALQVRLQLALGAALILAATTMVLKQVISRGRAVARENIRVRPLPTVLVGALGGLVVGITSVGSGSLIVVMLLVLYPTISGPRLVGTDLVQAVPLVAAAAIGHIFLGDFRLALTVSLLAGSIPGVYAGARLSSVAPTNVIRPVLALVLLVSGLKLFSVSTVVIGLTLLAGMALWLAALAWRRFEARADFSRPASRPAA